MAYQQIAGTGLVIPSPEMVAGTNTALTSTTAITATTHKIVFIGRVFNKDRTSKDITKIGVRTGTVVKAGGADLKLSIQGVSTSAGSPYQPDGTIKGAGAAGFATINNATLTTAAWNHSGALGANVTVSFGDLIAVVAESPSWAGADSIPLQGLNGNVIGTWGASGTVYYNGASWTALNVVSNVILEFTDGTFGTLDGGHPASASSSHVFNSGTGTADEYGLQFQFPFDCKVDGAWFAVGTAANTPDFNVLLCDSSGTTLSNGSVAMDANAQGSTSSRFWNVIFPADVTLSANTNYVLSIQPTTANNLSLYYFDVNDANHFQAHAGGTSWIDVGRLDAGATWTAQNSSKRRPFMGLRVSAINTSAGSTASGVIGG